MPKAQILSNTCGKGRYDKYLLSGAKYTSLLVLSTAQKEAKFLCDNIAAFGGPVVPLVYEKVKQSFGLTLL
jgi:hypothetical protein